MSDLRRVRAVAAVAMLWGVVWVVSGVALGHYLFWHGYVPYAWLFSSSDVRRLVLAYGAAVGGIGVTNGIAFGALLATHGRRRAAGRGLTAGRAARWGALAGLLAPVILSLRAASRAWTHGDGLPVGDYLAACGGGAALGALCGLATWAVCRRTPRRPVRPTDAPVAT